MSWEDPDPAEVIPLDSDEDWAELFGRYEPNVFPRPLARCLEVARGLGAKVVVVETRYIDLDYRSEYSSFFSKTFARIPDSAHRLHFFGSPVEASELAMLPDEVRARYLGYLTVRPSSLGRVGRTVLRPPEDQAAYIQAAVRDTVHFFGQDLTVVGVPFAQQDTQIGRCAHVAAWICHYTAYLRGDVGRRPMADFSLLADASAAEGRSLPSQGLTGLQLSNLMRDFGLAPIVYRMGALPESGREPPVPKHDEEDDPGEWDTRAIAVTCRFLNSSYPVLVGTHDHAFVIIGYSRYTRDGVPWIKFIRHDDQRGPYLEIDDIFNDIDVATGHRYKPWQLLLAAVPEKLWLLPEAAERVGHALLQRWDELEGKGDFAKHAEAERLSFRTFATSANRYKSVASERGLDLSDVQELRLARFSRLVWVVEAVDRERRKQGKPCVLGEVVFDATSSDIAPNVLVLRVPGALLVTQTDGTIRSPLPSTASPVLSAARWQP